MKYKTRSEHKQKDPKDYELALSINPEYLDEIYGELTSSEVKKTLILMWFDFFGTKLSQYSKDPEERRLSQVMGSYMCPASGSYDPEFSKLINKLSPTINTATINKKKIIGFIKKNDGRKPSQCSKDPIEKKLGQALVRYTSKGGNCYDPEFVELMNKLFPVIDTVKINKEKILVFVEDNKGKRPNQNSKDIVEKKLGQVLNRYTSKGNGSNKSYDPEFTKEINTLIEKLKVVCP